MRAFVRIRPDGVEDRVQLAGDGARDAVREHGPALERLAEYEAEEALFEEVMALARAPLPPDDLEEAA